MISLTERYFRHPPLSRLRRRRVLVIHTGRRGHEGCVRNEIKVSGNSGEDHGHASVVAGLLDVAGRQTHNVPVRSTIAIEVVKSGYYGIIT